jgi:ATP-dependent exoDNAse (exonuclease V) alpha subunit
MAIGFARLEFVQRSAGKNACAKSAYIGRDKVHFKGNEFSESKTYDWSRKEPVSYQEILLPKHANPSFLKAEVLWNAAEAKENRSNSQTAMEAVLALPDDLEVSLEDKIELAKSFVQKNFVDKGLGAQVVIHPPERKVQLDSETGEIENLEHNWHAHVLLTTRRFKENGEELEDKKARDLMPSIRNGKVISGPNWGEIWTEHQNQYFESRGMSLRVDPNGLLTQVHLGPVRLRGRALSIIEKNELQKELNAAEICNPSKLLEKITERKNIFSREDLTRLIHKFIGPTDAKELVDAAIAQKNVVQLFDRETRKLPRNPKTGELEERYTTMEVLLEEKRCLLHADMIHQKGAFHVNFYKCVDQFSSKLTSEQKLAFENILRGKRLSCIEGHAGTGKSHLLVALKNAYENEGYIVRAFGPDSATTEVLKDKGFSQTDNVYHFLFSVNRFEKIQEKSNNQGYRKASQLKRGHPHFAEKKNNKPIKEGLQIQKGKEVWLIDEATKLGNRPMQQILKFAEKYDAQVVFSGGASQLLPVERGCLYDVFTKRYGSQKLEDIQRQKDSFQRDISKKIAKGEMAAAIDRLSASGSIIWVDSKDEKPNPTIQGFIEAAFGEKLEYSSDKTKAIEELMKKWVADHEAFPSNSSIIIACSNKEVKALNEMVRTYRKEKGEIAKEEFHYEIAFGDIFVSQGDIIEFSSKNTELGVNNGTQGTLIKVSPSEFTVLVKDEKGKAREVSVDPNKYASFKLGYATTYFRSQGRTLDRAYILHSVHTNKEMFYVGLTRHVNKAYMFVPKSNFHYLSYLKAQAAGFGEGYGKYLALNDYFKGKDINSYLNDLTEQVSQETSKFATTDFVSADRLRKFERDQHIEGLKNSASPFSRLKGYSLSLWNQVSTKIEDYRENKSQEKKEAEFFNPVIKKLEEKVRIKEEAIYEPTAQEYRQAFVRSLILTKDKSPTPSPQVWGHLPANQQQLVSKYLEKSGQAWKAYYKVEKEREQNSASLNEWQKVCEERNALAYGLMKDLPKEAIHEILGEKYFETLRTQSTQHNKFIKIKENEISPSQNHQTQFLKAEKTAIKAATKFLSPEQEKLLSDYQQISKESSSLYALVQAEKENDNPSATHHTAWKVTCGKRNAAAYQLLKSTAPEVLSNILSQKSYEFLTEQAERHERLIKRNENRLEDLDTKLKNSLEPLLYRLFPEGPIRKSRGEWRFGSKGSLVVTCQGEKAGSFYSFAEEKGGGPLQLVQMTLGLDTKQARDWAKDFVGEAKDIIVPPSFKIKTQRVEKESEWISIKPNMHDPAPSLRNIPNCKLARYCKEESRYPYQNEKGELLFYTVRLVDKNGKKSVLPLSYGVGKDKNEAPHWAFKAYQSTQRSLYNLQLLQQNPAAKVVVVEGEKTADAANRLLNKHGMICLTWLGGASATLRTDWSPLEGREVIIWPDNDQSGFKAAGHICSELRKTGVKSLKVVDEHSLTKLFPPKWDLADPLPDGKKENLIWNLLMCANEKAVDITHLSFAVDKSNRDIELLKVREILWRVEERLRPELEKNLKERPNDIRTQLIKETLGIYRQKDQMTENLNNQLSLDNDQAERLTFQTLLYKAQHGQDPAQSKLLEMKTLMQNSAALLPKYNPDIHSSKAVHDLATDKALTSAFSDQKGKALSEIKMTFEKEILKTNQYLQQLQAQEMTQQRERSRGMDLSL